MGRKRSRAHRRSTGIRGSRRAFGLMASLLIMASCSGRSQNPIDEAGTTDLFATGSPMAAADEVLAFERPARSQHMPSERPANEGGSEPDDSGASQESSTSAEAESNDPIDPEDPVTTTPQTIAGSATTPSTTTRATTTPPTTPRSATTPPTTTRATTATSLDPPAEVRANSGSEQAELPTDAHFVSINGSDDAVGTKETPWRTLGHAVTELEPGSTLVVGPGTYGARGSITRIAVDGTASAPILIVGDPTKPRPIILGAVRVVGDHLKLRHLTFDGPTGPVLARTSTNPLGEDVQIAIYGDDVEISNCEIRENLWHAGIYLDGANDARIIDNHIHHNGNFARSEQANLDHGIYFESGSGLVSGNFIENNLAFGVHLYPAANGVIVEHNTIASHGRDGVIVAASSSNNLVRENVIAYNADEAVGNWRLTGTGNVVSNNVLWGNGAGDFGIDIDGLVFSDNVVREIAFPVTFQSDPGPR